MIKTDYISHMGTDMTVCDAARVSFDKEASQYPLEQNHKLIMYLAKHVHITPFTHPQITLRETVPIFVARQRFKHVVGFTYNEVSRRYVDDTPEFYIPDVWRNRPEGSVKQGSGSTFVGEMYFNDPVRGVSDFVHPTEAYNIYLEIAATLYEDMLKAGVAPEQARMVLPQSMLTSYYVTGSLAAWARAYKQRSDPHAQIEIQELAKQWDSILRPLYPVSWAALTRGEY